MSDKRFFYVGPDGKMRQVPTLDELLRAVETGGYAWLDFRDPDREDLLPLVDRLGVHALSVEDCLDENQVPKFEEFPANTFILVNGHRHRDGELVQEEVDLILGKNFVVTVSGHQGGSLKIRERVEEFAAKDPAAIGKGPDRLLYVVLDYVVDAELGAIETVQDAIDAAEEGILKSPYNFSPESLIRFRRELLTLRKSLFHEREILVKICRRDSPYVSERSIYHFRDIYDHLTKYFESVEICREMITSLMEIYLSTVNNRMARVANRTNYSVRRLTLITTVFMPLTLLAGIGGMSEWSMMTGPSNWKIAYPAFLLAMVVIGVINYRLLWLAERGRLAKRRRGGEADDE
jgi:magnesium transporter